MQLNAQAVNTLSCQTHKNNLGFRDDETPATLSTVEETLENFGLLKNEIKAYLHLAKAGPKKAKDICEETKIHRTEIYRVLRHLEKKSLVFIVLAKPIKFSAVPLNSAIDLLIEAQRTKLLMLENQKDVLVALWASIPMKSTKIAEKGLFQKLESEQQIIPKANELLERTLHELQIFVSDEYLAELYFGGFFDNLMKHRELDITLLTEVSQKSTYFLDKIKWPKDKRRMLVTQGVSTFIISDRKELLVAFAEDDASTEIGHRKKQKRVAIWTNYCALVEVMQFLFVKLLPKNGP